MSQQSASLPAGSSRPLAQFDLLIGEWATIGSHPAFPAEAHGASTFDWLVDGRLLRWRFEWKQPGPPSAISAIGRDGSADSCIVLYADERGVTRVYMTSLEDGVWRMWRDAPGSSQAHRALRAGNDSPELAACPSVMTPVLVSAPLDVAHARAALSSRCRPPLPGRSARCAVKVAGRLIGR